MHSSLEMVTPAQALAGRSTPIVVARPHLTFGVSMTDTGAPGREIAYLAMGCFWGAERKFFELDGVTCTAVGYQGGFTPNPTYQEVCTGRTGHTETVKVVFDSAVVSYREILQCFYENHDPTQGCRQGADIGTQYRSAIFFVDGAQELVAREVTEHFAARLKEAGYGPVTTEISAAGPFYMAEEYHQQYLVANPNGYCGLGGTGVSCPVGLMTD